MSSDAKIYHTVYEWELGKLRDPFEYRCDALTGDDFARATTLLRRALALAELCALARGTTLRPLIAECFADKNVHCDSEEDAITIGKALVIPFALIPKNEVWLVPRDWLALQSRPVPFGILQILGRMIVGKQKIVKRGASHKANA